MAKATVYNIKGDKIKEMELDPKIFGVEVNPTVVQQAIVAQQANSRVVLSSTKDKSEVAGGGRKPWRQKGTGRARHGSIRSPLWRGGGVTFGPTTSRNFAIKINRKARQKATLMALTDKAVHNKIVLLDDIKLDEAKTKKFFEILQQLDLRTKSVKTVKKSETRDQKAEIKKVKKGKEKSVLLVLSKKDENIQKATRNVPRLEILAANSLNVVDLLKHQYLLMPVDAIKEIEKTFVK